MDEKKTPKRKLNLKQKQARSEAVIKYVRKNYKRYDFKVHNEKDADIVAFMETKENKQAYIRELIRKDMENNQ